MIIGEPLFRNNSLDGYLRAQVEAIEDHVRHNVSKADLAKTDSEIGRALLAQAIVAPLEVDFDHPQKDVSEARVRVRDAFSGDVTIDGVRATRTFAFTGEAGLFELRTNPFSSVLPYGIVANGRVTIGMEDRNDAETLKREIDRQEQILRQYVGYARAQVDEHNRKLEGLLTEAVSRRRLNLGRIDDLRDRI